MISKITKGSNFHGLLNYLFSKPGAELFGSNVIADSALELANEMEESSRLSSKVEKPVGHFSLSVPPSDELSKVDWLKIASDYLKEMGYDCNKYAVVHHTDREHDHIHIAACRVREDTGKCVEDSWDYRQSEAVLRKLEQDYNLTPTPGSQEKDRHSPTTGERRLLARTGEDSVRVKLQNTIDELCSQQPTMPELIDLLKDQGIDVQVKETVNGSMGISYELDEVAFTGSHLGRAYTFNGLQKHRGVDYDSERDSDAIAQSANRPPVITSQNSTTTDTTDGSDDDNNETIGASSPNNKKVELPGQLPSLPELELELEAGDNEAASNDDEAATESRDDEAANSNDEKLNYKDIFAVPDDFDREFIQNRVRKAREKAQAKQEAEQARRTAEAIEYRRAEEQRINNIYKENINNPIFNELIPDEVKALFEESIAQENMGAIAPNELQSNDATAPEYASSFNHQTVPTELSDLSDQTAQPDELDDDDDQTDDEESVNVDPIEENWQPLRLYLIEDCCLPSEILDALHEEGWVYANNEDMAVFSLRTLKNVKTGVCVFDPESESNDWRDLILEPDVEKEANGEPAFFFIHPPNSELINKAILTSDPIEAISSAALDPSFGQNKTMYIGTESVDSLPLQLLNHPKIDVVVSFKGDEDGLELAKDVMKVLPKSQKEELDEAGWNGILKAHEQQAEQMQLMAQYQSQQESEMEL